MSRILDPSFIQSHVFSLCPRLIGAVARLGVQRPMNVVLSANASAIECGRPDAAMMPAANVATVCCLATVRDD